MSFKHKLFGFIFNRVSQPNIKNKQVTFIIDSNKSFLSNYNYIIEEFEKKGDFEFFFFNKNNWKINDLKKLSQSKFIFLNDNFLAMAYMNFNPHTIITQVWHAPGAFKKFGASSSSNNSEIDLIKKANEKVTYLINTSQKISKFYSDAFQIDKSKIKSLGIPRMDFYFKNNSDVREKFNSKYPFAKNKKIILYAPTFRDNKTDNEFFDFLDLNKFNEELGEEYVLAVRFHPNFNNKNIDGDFINVTDFKNEQELLLIADLLISDYSSITIEFLSLNKPIILFTYDLERYLENDRGFYFDLTEKPFGEIVTTSDELINLIKNNKFNIDNSEFIKTQFDTIDGKASQRIVELVLK